MKLYSIVEPFSPADGERWTSYCEWRALKPNALVTDLDTSKAIHSRLKKEFGDDNHVEYCRIVSVYNTKSNKAVVA